MARLPYVLPCLLLAACKFGDDRPLGGEVDAAVDGPTPGALHLLITEVQTNGVDFFEIWNPTNRTIDLSNYYLSDFGNYWKLPEGLSGVDADFVVRFPSGAQIESNQVITICTDAAVFKSAYSANFGLPTYDLKLSADSADAKAFRGRIVTGATPTITNTGEFITLFYWDGMTDNVQDVDIVMAGTSVSGSTNVMQNKMAVDGPDGDTVKTAYKTENGFTGGGMAVPDSQSTSYKRKSFETGYENQNGQGNGLFGDDETSEQFKQTWDAVLTPATPNRVPTF